MNRETRRRAEKEARRNSNSKMNFKNVGTQAVSIDSFSHNPELKECDKELLELMKRSFGWNLKNITSKDIVDKGLSYLDSLSSLRFDITPVKDKKLVRDTMHFISDMANMFLGLYYIHNKEKSVRELMQESINKGETEFALPIPQHEGIAPYYGDVLNLPSRDRADDIYASFVIGHANDLGMLLYDTKYKDVSGDEKEIFEVLLLISKKTMQLLPEATSN